MGVDDGAPVGLGVHDVRHGGGPVRHLLAVRRQQRRVGRPAPGRGGRLVVAEPHEKVVAERPAIIT